MQTTYNREMDGAFAGMLADAGDNDVVSRQAEEAIQFGYGVTQGSTDSTNGCRLPDADTELLVGVTAHEHNEGGVYAAGSTVNIVKKGRVWVVTNGTAVTVGAPAYVVDTTGKLTGTSSGNIAAGGIFLTAQTTDGGLALLEINRP